MCPEPRRLPQHLLAPLAIALALLTLLPGIWGGYVFDDHPSIADNPAFSAPIVDWRGLWEATFSSASSSIGRPLAMLTFSLNFALTGIDPFWFKLTNLLLHAFNGVLLWHLMRRVLALPDVSATLVRARVDLDRASMCLAFAWTVLAIHISAIFLVVQRMEMLAHTLALCALIFYLDGRRRQIAGLPGGNWRVAFGLVLLPAIGVLAKESAVLAPAYAFALEIFLLRFRARDRSARTVLSVGYAMLFLVALGILARWILPAQLEPAAWEGRNFDLAERLWSELRILWLYLRWIVVPDLSTMSLYHDAFQVSRGWLQPATTLVAALAWLGVFASLGWLARGPSLAGFGIAFFLIGHLLTATVFQLELIFEHRNYTASVGVLILLMTVVLRLRVAGAHRLSVALVAIFVLAQMATASLRAFEWGHPLRHAVAEAARNPESPRAVYELGRVEYMLSGADPAHPAFELAVRDFQRAASLPGASALPLQGMLVAASAQGAGDEPELWSALQQRLREARLDTQSITAVLGLVTCAGKGNCKFPIGQLVRTLAIAVDRERPPAELLVAYGTLALTHLQDLPLAGELFQAAVAAEPGNPLRQHSYGQYLAIVGDFDGAEAAARRMEQLDRFRRYRSRSDALWQMIGQLRAQSKPAAG